MRTVRRSPPRQVILHAKRFAFTPAEITLKKGRKTIIQVPTRTGGFPGSCSIFCGPGHRDMEFVIHVVE